MAVYFLLAPHSMCVKIGYNLHRDFADDRLRGEWFKLTPRLRGGLEGHIDDKAARLLRSVDDFDPNKWNCNPYCSQAELYELCGVPDA